MSDFKKITHEFISEVFNWFVERLETPLRIGLYSYYNPGNHLNMISTTLRIGVKSLSEAKRRGLVYKI